MTCVGSCPEKSVSLPSDEPIIKLVHLAHTSLLIILTNSSVYLLNQHTLLPIAFHTRTPESVEQLGRNTNVKTKHVSVNTSQLQKLTNSNLFVQTEKNDVIIYQVSINWSNSLYELTNSKNDQILQKGLPVSLASQKFTLTSIFKNAAKIIQSVEKPSINLENIEHKNNAALEDELGGFEIESAKISIFKVLKIKIGLERYWLKSNSHNLIIYNGQALDEERIQNGSKDEQKEINSSENANGATGSDETKSGTNDDTHDDHDLTKQSHFQIINIQTFKNSVLSISDCDWYAEKSKIIYINYNIFHNYFIFINELREVWSLRFEADSRSGEIIPVGVELKTDLKNVTNPQIIFNPQYDLVLVVSNETLQLYKIDLDRNTMDLIKLLETVSGPVQITWSSCGDFFVVVDLSSGIWSMYSKFGSKSFDSSEILNELEDRVDENRQFLKASRILISANSTSLFLINQNESKLYTVDLLTQSKQSQSPSTFYDSNYLSVIYGEKSFARFPLLAKFKSIIRKIEVFNGTIDSSPRSFTGKLLISKNSYNQFAISYGDHISISTPFTSVSASIPWNNNQPDELNSDINHILWFNFKNFISESMNIVNHFWFMDYLVIINRKISEDSGESEEIMIDEIIVLNTTNAKYGNGGENFSFDSDTILWKYDFKTTFISVDPVAISNSSSNVILLTKDHRLIILELHDKKHISKDQEDAKIYNIFIGVNKTIHLSTIRTKLKLENTIKSAMINKLHFLFLLNTGELYLLKNQSSGNSIANQQPIDAIKPSNMYDLILVSSSVEKFNVQNIELYDSKENEYLEIFDGSNLSVFDIKELVDDAYDNSTHIADGLESDLESSNLKPITIELDNYQPVALRSKSALEVIVLENQIIDRVASGGLIVRPKLSHKLVLNNFIEYDLLHNSSSLKNISDKYSQFKRYNYCLELLLVNYLTDTSLDPSKLLKDLIELIELSSESEYIFINCLRKIEIAHWKPFFEVLNITPVDFMNRLIEKKDVELCYTFLIVYLNFKKEDSSNGSTNKSNKKKHNKIKSTDYTLDANDKSIILKIISMLDTAKKWEWCFDLCRFVKLLEPSGVFLKEIQQHLT